MNTWIEGFEAAQQGQRLRILRSFSCSAKSDSVGNLPEEADDRRNGTFRATLLIDILTEFLGIGLLSCVLLPKQWTVHIIKCACWICRNEGGAFIYGAEVLNIGTELEDMQEIVEGDIELIMPFEEDVAIITNGLNKIPELPPNRAIYGDGGQVGDIIRGNFFIAYASIESESFEKYII